MASIYNTCRSICDDMSHMHIGIAVTHAELAYEPKECIADNFALREARSLL